MNEGSECLSRLGDFHKIILKRKKYMRSKDILERKLDLKELSKS